jgi:SP family sugar:H+ symporter-like MFS transporter
MSLATASNWLWNFLLAFFTPFITGAIDFRFGYVFAGCLFLAAGLVYVAVIEGQGRTLEEIDTMYLMKVKPWKSSKFQFPADPNVIRGSFDKGGDQPVSAHVEPTTELREDGTTVPDTRS